MINRKLVAVGLGAALTLGLTACDMDSLTDINVNPNNPTDAPAPTLFVQGTRLATSRWLGGANLRQFELVAQHLAEVQYPNTDQYSNLTADYTSANFNATYAQELKDLQEAIRKGREQQAPGYWAPSLIMQSWVFGVVTDLYGDIPFSQALRGDDVEAEGRIQPAYDPQQEVYNALFARLGEASTALSTTGGANLGGADPLYGGNFAAWQRFANSLRARHALRIVNVDRARADAELRAAFTAPGGVFTSNAHNARFPWPGNGVFDNPWAVNFQTRDDHRVSTRLLTYLRDWSDPRLPIYAMPADRDTAAAAIATRTIRDCSLGVPCFVGLHNALSHDEASTLLDYTSRPGAVFFGGRTAYGTFGGAGGSFPSFIMTNAEVQLIQAEAAERGLGGLTAGQARGFYEAGIRASMEQWGVTDAAAISAYLARPGVAYQGGTPGLRQIAIQKWLALYSDGVQAWSEFRRTCQPAILRPGPSATLNEIPRRLQYSTTEAAVNATNLGAAVTRQGADQLTTRIWWDSNPSAAPTFQTGCGVR
jgi:hypothetical protein